MNKVFHARQRLHLRLILLNLQRCILLLRRHFGDDAFVTKINPAGSALVYSTLHWRSRPLRRSHPMSTPGFGLQSIRRAMLMSPAWLRDFSDHSEFLSTFQSWLATTPSFRSCRCRTSSVVTYWMEATRLLSGVEVVLNDGWIVDYVCSLKAMGLTSFRVCAKEEVLRSVRPSHTSRWRRRVRPSTI